MLEELVDLDEERLTVLDMLIWQKERVAKTYKKKVEPKDFFVNDLVWNFFSRESIFYCDATLRYHYLVDLSSLWRRLSTDCCFSSME